MARIPLWQPDDPELPEGAGQFLHEAAAARGRLLNLHRALANHPPAGRAVMTMVNAVYRAGSTLHPRHGEIAYLTATAVNNCHY